MTSDLGAQGSHQPSSPCQSPEARQFDFWLGEWQVSWGEEGEGTNTVERILDGCVIQERFDGGQLQGLSHSVYDPAGQVWRQTWVDNSGGYLDFEGGMDGDHMILSRRAVIQGKAVLQRMVWYNIARDTLDWNWERSDDGGLNWRILWQIRYRRRT